LARRSASGTCNSRTPPTGASRARARWTSRPSVGHCGLRATRARSRRSTSRPGRRGAHWDGFRPRPPRGHWHDVSPGYMYDMLPEDDVASEAARTEGAAVATATGQYKLGPASLTEALFASLRERIINGDIPPGEKV